MMEVQTTVNGRVLEGEKLTLRQVGITATAHAELLERMPELQARLYIVALLEIFTNGTWGDVDEHDRQVNDAALKTGGRIMGAYQVQDLTVWIIADASPDPKVRETTTIMLPRDY